MKEKIYTIPISEALEQDSFCPFCYIYQRLEEDAVSYTLGPAMMEPDFRIFTNERGFCQKHMRELHGKREALSLALVTDTHLDKVLRVMEQGLAPSKKSLFKKKKQGRESFVSELKRITDSCAVCSRVENAFSGYFDTFVFMLKKEKDFLDRILSTEGFCLEHFSRLLSAAHSRLSDSEFEKYFVPIIELQKERLEKAQVNTKKFADSFDYRNAGKNPEVPRDTLLRTANLLNGEFEPKN